jgi:hypothetical protein
MSQTSTTILTNVLHAKHLRTIRLPSNQGNKEEDVMGGATAMDI